MRRVRRKGGNKEKVFGCDLLEYLAAQSQEIPLVLRCCSEFVEKHGIVDGIYRLSGVSSNIQKLRGEFEGDGSPDLEKDVYLQDIHCVSSLCKAYFRELPNPLLTYQLYDKFAEAVAIQLEEERLVKIRDVLKELPALHYRTLEFLMRHLVKMASYSSETNMHARNLAIVWAPNLLRSKDIEASGFNGTAAFMEVRVQSIVVEFILTHVPQLFPTKGVSNERRNSLPSPTAASISADGLFKFSAAQPMPNFGHISPGDGPLPIRPYHAIIEGTDKRKGSLKGRKWMSIFNIGGRFHDPRRRHKNSAKEKERPTLRPARSMDSLSTPAYPNEASRRPAQRPPSNTSPLAPTPQHSPPDAAASTPAVGGSEYAVTYRRGTGLVSGGAGTQGTYTALDPEGLGLAGCEHLQSRSPGLSAKAGRRAAMHITGPTLVTVPLHITSNLALGVLQGGGASRIIHRGRERDEGDRVEDKEGRERKESIAAERKVEERRKEEEDKESNRKRKVTEVEAGGNTGEGVAEEVGKKEDEEEKKEVREEERREPKMSTQTRRLSREKRAKSVTSNTEEGDVKNAPEDGQESDCNDGYIDMSEMMLDLQPEETQHNDVFDTSDVLNSTEVEGDDLGLSGYVQDNFEFLDQMDFSVMDHMDCGAPYQVNEFSVEPPGHSDDEYEVMEQYQCSHHPTEDTHQHPGHETHMLSPTEMHKHRPLSIDLNSRHTKSLSLPYITSPVHDPEELSSEEESDEEPDEDENEGYCSDEDMFVKSLPCDYFLNSLGFEGGADRTDRHTLDGVAVHETSQETDCEPMNLEPPTCEISHDGQLEKVDVKEEEVNDGLEEKGTTEEKEEVHQDGEELENKSKATEEDQSVLVDSQSDEEQPPSTEESSHCCSELPQLFVEEPSTTLDSLVEKREAVSDDHDDYPPFPAAPEEFGDFFATEESRFCVRGDGDEGKDRVSNVGTSQEIDMGRKESEESMRIETEMDSIEQIAEEEHVGKWMTDGKEEEDAIQDELEDDVCGVTKDEGGTQEETKAAKESAIEREDKKFEEEHEENTRGEEKVKEGGENETEVEVEPMENTEENPMQQAGEENGSNLPSPTELVDEIQEKCAISKETQHHDGGEVAKEEAKDGKKEVEKQRIRIQSLDKKVKAVQSDIKTLKDGKGGVGRTLVVSKQPKFYQVKAVPVVPPKPQHCKITAMTLRQQQKERRDADRERENTPKKQTEGEKVSARWQEKDGEDGDEEEGRMERPEHRGGDRWRDVDDGFTRDRNSPLSMNFEEAVAIATMKREKEKECEKEKERQKD